MKEKIKNRGRAITVDGKLYYYRVGRGRVAIYGEGARFIPSCAEVIGVSEATFERGQWKKTSDGQVTPGLLARWIREKESK